MDKNLPSILNKIITAKKKEVALLKSGNNYEELMEKAQKRVLKDFFQALKDSSPAIISEIKKASPSKGLIAKDFNPRVTALNYKKSGASAISVLTDKDFFQGSYKILKEVRETVDLPLLQKDFIIDEIQILKGISSGADTFLLIAAVLDLNELKRFLDFARSFSIEPLVEIHNEEESVKALQAGAKIIGINNRNLHNFSISLNTSEKLLPKLPANIIKVSESGIESPEDIKRLVKAGADALLIGTSLMQADNQTEFLKGLKNIED